MLFDGKLARRRAAPSFQLAQAMAPFHLHGELASFYLGKVSSGSYWLSQAFYSTKKKHTGGIGALPSLSDKEELQWQTNNQQ
jgi:hypothetical protein